MRLYLALDAGGTKTECCLADENRVLARSRTGSVKLMRVDEAEATLRLRNLLAEVASIAGVSLGDIHRTCMGLAGLSIAEVRQWARLTLAAELSGEILLAGDEEIALDAAFQGGPGILVIAGTGSNFIGRESSGRLRHAGGWGPAIGDEGSGHWIGNEAVRSALHAYDREQPTPLLDAIQHYWELTSLPALIGYANQRPGPNFAGLVPVVAQAAEFGDRVALDVLRRAGRALAQQVLTVRRKLTTDTETPFQVAYTGGILANLPVVRETMSAALQVQDPSLRFLADPVDPIDGALWLARHPVHTVEAAAAEPATAEDLSAAEGASAARGLLL